MASNLPASLESPDTSNLAGVTKVAIFLMRAGKDQAAVLLKYMRESEVAAVTAEIARLNNVPQEDVAATLGEFRVISAAQRNIAMGGVEFARELLVTTLGAEKASEILERLHVTFVDAPFEVLRKADPRQVLGFWQEVHPQTIAFIVAHLPLNREAINLSGLV